MYEICSTVEAGRYVISVSAGSCVVMYRVVPGATDVSVIYAVLAGSVTSSVYVDTG